MPETSGRALAEQMALIRPDTKVLFMSGHTDYCATGRGVPKTGILLLQKPFTRDALARKVREVLDIKDPVKV
jgi:FixJ family two-component response regulator